MSPGTALWTAHRTSSRRAFEVAELGRRGANAVGLRYRHFGRALDGPDPRVPDARLRTRRTSSSNGAYTTRSTASTCAFYDARDRTPTRVSLSAAYRRLKRDDIAWPRGRVYRARASMRSLSVEHSMGGLLSASQT